MKLPSVATLFSVVLLSACGGGETSPTASFSTLNVLGSGEGVARGTTSDGRQALVYTPGVVDVVAAANSGSSDTLNVSASDFPVVSTSGNAVIRQGTISSGGYTFNVTALQDTRVSDAAAVFVEMPAGSADISMVTGTAYTNALTTGTYTYSGTQASAPRTSVSPTATGAFSMTANFGAQTFSYTGTSGSVNVIAAGSLDTANGRFATNSASVSVGGTSYTGTMHGLLHGNAGSATSGIFYTNGSAPSYTGAFIGAR